MATRVLIADDDDFCASTVQALLSSLSIESEIVTNGIECCEKLESEPGKFHIVLMDFWMPEMDGLEATRCIKDLGLGQVNKVYGITADSDPEIIAKGRNSGMDDVFIKPLSIPTLRKILP
ncbi:unnamed protein product [Blepharisma stoltei]|uniref:Response regulatory domain-containing protein n=1 Tax=Blepharisma stoltei TaxID=1481888 RepID=A0AAU9KCE5_9CILI|nr:unnamed protein product [Blepharisma stoltei]